MDRPWWMTLATHDSPGIQELEDSALPEPMEAAKPAGGIDATDEEKARMARALGVELPPKPPPADSFASKAPNKGTADDLQAYAAPWETEPPPGHIDRFAIGSGSLGIYPLKCVSVVASTGGVGKTTTLISHGLHIAAGKNFAGHDVHAGGVLFLSLEEDADDIGRRVGATATTQFPASKHEVLKKRFSVIAMPGVDGRLTESVARTLFASSMRDRLVRQASIHAKAIGMPIRLIAIDHARLAASGDLNNSEDASVLMRTLASVAVQTGAAVVLLAHSPKSSLRPDREDDFSAADILGSGAFHDLARFAAVLSPLTATERKRFALDPEGARRFVAFRVIKSNFSETGRATYLRKVPVDGWGVAVVEPVELRPPEIVRDQSVALDSQIIEYIKTQPGLWTANKFCKQWAGSDSRFKAGRPALQAAIGRLVASGRLAARKPTAEERATGTLAGRDSAVLFVQSGPAQ